MLAISAMIPFFPSSSVFEKESTRAEAGFLTWVSTASESGRLEEPVTLK
jgi:hypothetical protein